MSIKAITLATKEAAAELTNASAAQAMIEGLAIVDDESNEFAAEILRDVKARHKALEKQRKAITTPMLEAKKQVDALFKPPRAALELAEATLKGKITDYIERVDAANTAAIQAASAAETVEDAAAALATVTHADAPTGVSVRYVWDAEVIAEDLLDRRFMSPDDSKIKAWAKEHTGPDGAPLAIPGVKFTKRPIVASRAKLTG